MEEMQRRNDVKEKSQQFRMEKYSNESISINSLVMFNNLTEKGRKIINDCTVNH